MAMNPYMPPRAGSSPNGTPLFEVICPDCGAERTGDKRKVARPCAPCAAQRRRTHGLSDHPLYRVLKGMEARCKYPSLDNYKYYGGRGIRVCDLWRGFPEKFIHWALDDGWRPGLEVDRIDPDGDYSPDNCRIVTHRTNSQRRRNAAATAEKAGRVRRLHGAGMSVSDAAKAAGVTYMAAWHIVNNADVWRGCV